jgi:hypothetical protein
VSGARGFAEDPLAYYKESQPDDNYGFPRGHATAASIESK